MTPAQLEKTIAHEAGHAIGLLLQGHDVAEVGVDHDRVGQLGRVTADFTNSSPDLGYLIACLMGPMAADEAPPEWPPDPEAVGDERSLAVLVDYLGMDRGDYEIAIDFARAWLDWHEFKAAHALLCSGLSRVPVLSGQQVRELLGPRLARLNGEEAACST